MNPIKLFFLKQRDDIQFLSYQTFSFGSIVGEDKHDFYIKKHIQKYVSNVLKDKGFKKISSSETLVIEVLGEIPDNELRKHKIKVLLIRFSPLEKLSEEQKLLVGLPPIIRRGFLEEIGIKDYCQNWGRLDNRQPEWQKDQQEYSFDERATWCLDEEIKRLIYERLVFFQRYAPKPSEELTPKMVYKKKEYTLEEYLDEILEGLKLDLTLDEFAPERKNKKTGAKIKNALPMLFENMGCLWW